MIPVVYTSSIQVDRDNAYGVSKLGAEIALFALQTEHAVPVCVDDVCINPGNDLEGMILREGVGRVCIDQSAETLQRLAFELVDQTAAGATTEGNTALAERCKTLSARLFFPKNAVDQIVNALQPNHL